MEGFSKEQEVFIKEHIKRSAGDIWHEELVRLRGIEVGDDMTLEEIADSINQWELVEIVDGGEGKRPYRCICKKAIRYKYVVRHKTKDITYGLGSECVKNYTGIDSRVARKVLVEHKAMNRQVEEIRTKLEEGALEVQYYLLDEEVLPVLYREQLEKGLPLTDRQLHKVFQLLDKKKHRPRKVSREIYDMLKAYKEEELAYINSLTLEERQGLIVKLKDGRTIYTLDELKVITPSMIAQREEKQEEQIEENAISLDAYSHKKPSIDQVQTKSSAELNVIKQALRLLTEKQQEFWLRRMSLKQRKETASYILEGSHKIRLGDIPTEKIDKKIRQQVILGLPLTKKQIEKLDL